MSSGFRAGLTRDFLTPEGELTYRDIGLAELDAAAALSHEFFDRHETTVTADQLAGYDAVISLTPRYTAQSFEGAERLLAVMRFGVGYDMVDVEACTAADVLLCITAGAVNRPVAEATIGWMLALNHRIVDKDRLVRGGGWARRGAYMGSELRDRTVGIVGLGGIGKKLVGLLGVFGIKGVLAHDPYANAEEARALGVRLASLNEVMSEADFVSVNCPLTEGTRNLIGAEQLALMKPEAFLINTARGGIVNEAALLEVLRDRRIAGAATDVFEAEPVPADHPFLQLDNILLAPHCIAWTDELFRDMGLMAARGVIALSQGQVPGGVVNREVLQHPGFVEKLARFNEKDIAAAAKS